MLDYYVSLHNLVKLFVLFKTSPRSSKTKSGIKSYWSFCAILSCVFAWAEVPAQVPTQPKLRPGSVTCVSICRKFRWGRESGPNGQISLALFKGSLFPKVSPTLEVIFASSSTLSPPLLTFKSLPSSLLPPMILASLWGIWERRSRSTIPTKPNPFFMKESLGSRSWRVLCSPLVFFLSYSPIAFVALIEFKSERLASCIWCICLSSNWRFGEFKLLSLFSWVLAILDGCVEL